MGEIFDSGVAYSAISTARSALSAFLYLDGKPAGDHPLVRRFLRGVFAIRPALPRHQVIWDVSKVLNFLRCMHPPESLSLKDLSLKLITLYCIAFRSETSDLIGSGCGNTFFTGDAGEFRIAEISKQTRPSYQVPELVFSSL